MALDAHRDPLPVACAAVLLMLMTLVASVLPARRASRIDASPFWLPIQTVDLIGHVSVMSLRLSRSLAWPTRWAGFLGRMVKITVASEPRLS